MRKIDYTGDKRFRVSHPEYGDVVVAAPDDASAVYAAGYALGTDPTRIAFYAYCTVTATRLSLGIKKKSRKHCNAYDSKRVISR